MGAHIKKKNKNISRVIEHTEMHLIYTFNAKIQVWKMTK